MQNGVEVHAPAAPQVAVRKASQRSPILSLVDREYLKSTANLPRPAWEAVSYLYSEADKAVARVTAMAVPGCDGPNSCQIREDDADAAKGSREGHNVACLEWVRASTLKDWGQVLGWLDEVLQHSQSIDALRSWQLTSGLQAQNAVQSRASAGVTMPDFPQPVPPGPKPKRGILRSSP